MKALLLLLSFVASAADLPYWIEPRAGGDGELAVWALQAWENASGGEVHFVPSPSKDKALLRVLWVTGANGLYGEARPIMVDGQRGAELYVRPEMDGLRTRDRGRRRKDRLLRDAIVYLTCLHECGHGSRTPSHRQVRGHHVQLWLRWRHRRIFRALPAPAELEGGHSETLWHLGRRWRALPPFLAASK